MTHCATYWIMTTRAVKGISNFKPQGDTAIRLTVQQDVLREVDARKSLRCVLAVHVLRRAGVRTGRPAKEDDFRAHDNVRDNSRCSEGLSSIDEAVHL